MDYLSEELSSDVNRWVFERFETTLQGITNLAGVLLGFMGIELTLVFQNSKQSTHSLGPLLLGLLLAGIFLIGAILPTPIFLPNSSTEKPTKLTDKLGMMMDKLLFGRVNNKQSLLAQMRKKVINRKIWFGIGVLVLSIDQDVLLSLLSRGK